MRKSSTGFFPHVPVIRSQIARVETVRQLVRHNKTLSPHDFKGFGGNKLFSGYMPHMVSIAEAKYIAEHAIANAAKTALKAQSSTLRRFWLAGCDAKKLPTLLPYAVIQIASQSNGNESPNRIITPPSKYKKDPTQGPRSQLADIIAAIARYQQITHCDFLKTWREHPEFSTIFFEENGYLTPNIGMEREAAQFLSQHIHELLINVERIDPTVQHTNVQVLSFGLALGIYDFPIDDDLRSGTREHNQETQTQLALCSRILLEAEYQFAAYVAITEALANPEKRIPLVLTMVGGGVFGNSACAIAHALSAAETEIMRSGVTNIDLCISAWKPTEINQYMRLLEKEQSLFADKSTPVISQNSLEKTTLLDEAASLERIQASRTSFFSKGTGLSNVIEIISKKMHFTR